MIAKADPLLRKAIQGGRVVAGGSGQLEPRLIAYHQNDVHRLVRWPGRAGRLGYGAAARPLGGRFLPVGDPRALAVYRGGRHGARGGTEPQ